MRRLPLALLLAPLLLLEPTPASGVAIQDGQTGLREKRRAESEDEPGFFSKAKGYLNKNFLKAINNAPPNLKKAFTTQDFSEVTEEDIKQLDPSVMELIPRSAVEKMDLKILKPIVDALVNSQRPTGLSRIVEYAGEKLGANYLLDQIHGNNMDKNDETKKVLLYMAMEKLSDKGMVDRETVQTLQKKGLLESVLPSQLVGITDPGTATSLISNLFGQGLEEGMVHHNLLEGKALLSKLTETAYGEAKGWTSQNLQQLSTQVPSLPSEMLKHVSDKAVAEYINKEKGSDVLNPQLGMTMAKKYISNTLETMGNSLSSSFPNHISAMMDNMGNLAAFVPMDMMRNMPPDTRLVAMDEMTKRLEEMGEIVPVEVRQEIIKQKMDGKPLEQLNENYAKELGSSLLSVAAPSVIEKIKKWNIFNTEKLSSIAKFANDALGQGLINQVGRLANDVFVRSGSKKVDLTAIPAAFLGSVPLDRMNELNGAEVREAVSNLRKDPSKLSEAQSGMLLNKLRESDMLNSVAENLPPQMKALLPAVAGAGGAALGGANFLRGLPTSSEHRMRAALGHLSTLTEAGKNLTAKELEEYPDLVSVLTPEHVAAVLPDNIPNFMLAVKNAPEGPSTQVLWALKKRLDEYLRQKGNPDASERQLLKGMSQAEFVNIPGSVLALFDEKALTDSKIMSDKKREILTALGDLPKSDYLEVPRGQREAIIEEGLKALEELGKAQEVDVEQLTALGNAVQDLPASAIDKLTPVALEQVLPVLQGTEDDFQAKEDDDEFGDDPKEDRLRIKACLNPEQRKALEKRILDVFGSPKWWDPATVAVLCCSLDLLSPDKLKLVRDATILDCHCKANDDPPAHLREQKEAALANCGRELGSLEQLEKDIQKVEERRAEAALAIADQIVLSKRRRRKRAESEGKQELTCEAVRLATSGSAFSVEQLSSMDSEEVPQCLFELGRKKLCEKRSKLLWKKLVQNYDNQVKDIPPEVLRNAGWVSRGMDPDDALHLPLDDLDVLSAFGQDHMLTQEQLTALANRVKEVRKMEGVDYNSQMLIFLKYILCGYTREDVEQFKPSAFLQASPVLRTIRRCRPEVMSGFATLATGQDAYGASQKWTAADVKALGSLFAGLSPSDVASVTPHAFRGLIPDAVRNMPDASFQELSVEQASNFPREAAQAVSEQQLNQLHEGQSNMITSLAGGERTVAAAPGMVSSWSVMCLSLLLTLVTRGAIMDS